MTPDDAARNRFISRGGDPRPGSLVSHQSEIIQERATTLPLLSHRENRKKNRSKSKYASPPSCTISLNIECALFLCHLEILLTYHRKAGGSVLNKQCYPISQKWYTDHFVRGQNWILLFIFFSLSLSLREMWYLNWLHLGVGRMKEGAVHKSFLDIAASLPQTRFFSPCLSLSLIKTP